MSHSWRLGSFPTGGEPVSQQARSARAGGKACKVFPHSVFQTKDCDARRIGMFSRVICGMRVRIGLVGVWILRCVS